MQQVGMPAPSRIERSPVEVVVVPGRLDRSAVMKAAHAAARQPQEQGRRADFETGVRSVAG
jgi:hypothetical protein